MIRKSLLLGALLIVLLTSVMQVFSQELLTLDTPLRARYQGEPVSFLLNGQANQAVLIRVTSTADFALEVYDAQDRYLTGDMDSGGGFNPAVGVLFPEDGQYRVAVVAYSPQAVEAEFEIIAQPLEVITSGEVALGQTIRNLMTVPQVTFDFTLEGQTNVLAQLLTYNFPSQLALLDGQGQIIREVDDIRLMESLPAGRYTLQLRAFGDLPTIAPYYALEVQAVDVVSLVLDQPQTVPLDGQRVKYFTFEAEQGDVIDLVVTSAEPFNASGTSFNLISPSRTFSFFSESSVSSSYLVGLMLPETGTYQVELYPPFAPVTPAPLTLSLARGQRDILTAEPFTFELGAEIVSRGFDALVEVGKSYRVIVETNRRERPITISVNAGEFASLSAFNSAAVMLEFVAANPVAEITVRLDVGFNVMGEMLPDQTTQLTIRVEEVNR